MDAATAPLVVHHFGRDTCIVDAGYAWMKQIADGAHSVINTHFDAGGTIVMWYIDICLRTGLSEDGVPWFDDLYLDLAVSPALEVVILDADELQEARERGEISAEVYDLAWNEANRLVEGIQRGEPGLLGLSKLHQKLVEESNHRSGATHCPMTI